MFISTSACSGHAALPRRLSSSRLAHGQSVPAQEAKDAKVLPPVWFARVNASSRKRACAFDLPRSASGLPAARSCRAPRRRAPAGRVWWGGCRSPRGTRQTQPLIPPRTQTDRHLSDTRSRDPTFCRSQHALSSMLSTTFTTFFMSHVRCQFVQSRCSPLDS